MRKKSQQFLYDLLGVPTVSGYEQPGQRVVREYITGAADTVETDSHGNVIACLGPERDCRVMLAGHVDQIGLLVQHIEDSGFLRVSGVGGFDIAILLGQTVVVWTDEGPLPGVIARAPTHLLSAEARGKMPELDKLWIDTGLADAKAVRKQVRIGDPVTYTLRITELGRDLIAAPGMDDKVGAFCVIEALRLLAGEKELAAGIHAVSTVQEEIGLRGARTSAFRVDPQVGIAVDVTFATDQPDVGAAKTGEVKLGDGPVISRGPNFNPVVVRRLIEAAEAEKIPFQLCAAPRATGTDANAIQISRAGVAAGLVSIPNRYMHSPVEVCSLKDIENGAKLLAAFCRRMSGEVDLTP